ncbi:MAG: nitroreductase family protein [Desulfobulbus sp.]|jgi:nitroreductase|uniref:nitroreductase family protein n=1 Tax=Desulfobulbus sp. TaxID=895 RepID=UPI0028522AC9|nr:nitroreductase family protein [Desulfobulbus sp.]MDR2550948.1 nitroreductase family protein [Desulfobulbus sp.]
MELQEAILKRRSVRRFTDDVVTDQELQQLFEAVRWAPSWGNTQVWEFVVVRDKELIQKITETYRMDKGTNPATKCSQTASALIVVCAKTGVSGCYGGKENTKFANWFMFDLGIATQTLCLRAHEMGLGTVVVGLLDHNACKQLVALPEGYEAVAVLPIGRPAVEQKAGPPRKAVADMVYRDTFGNKMF